MNTVVLFLIGLLFIAVVMMYVSIRHITLDIFSAHARLNEVNAICNKLVSPIPVPIVLSKGAFIPKRAHGDEDACYDIIAPYDIRTEFGRQVLPTGIKFSVPFGYVAIVLPTSGNTCKGFAVMSKKDGSTIIDYRINADACPGVIDPGYIGEIGVLFNNHMNPRKTDADFTIKKGTKLGQILFLKTEKANFIQVESLPDTTNRATNGFGSTDGSNLSE